MQPRERQRKFTRLLELLASSDAHRLELSDPELHRRPIEDSFILKFLCNTCRLPEPTAALAEFKSWLGNHRSVPPSVQVAFQAAKLAKAASEVAKYDLLRTLMLNPNNPGLQLQIRDLWENIPVYFVQSYAKDSAYPPVGEWIAETEEIREIWHHRVAVAPLPDSRQARHPMHLLDLSRLEFNLEPHSSAIFKDAVTHEVVMVVMRDFCRDKGVLDWISNVVLENIKVQRNICVRMLFKISVPPLTRTPLSRKKTVGAWSWLVSFSFSST